MESNLQPEENVNAESAAPASASPAFPDTPLDPTDKAFEEEVLAKLSSGRTKLLDEVRRVFRAEIGEDSLGELDVGSLSGLTFGYTPVFTEVDFESRSHHKRVLEREILFR